jgi:hypothetical protein
LTPALHDHGGDANGRPDRGDDTPPDLVDDFGPFAAAVAAALSPTGPDAMIFPQDNDTPPDSEEAAFWLLITELEGCDLHVQSELGALPEASCACTFSCLPVAVRKCGTQKKKKKKQKLNSKEALPSKEAYSGFNVSSVQRFAVPRKQTVPSRDMAVGISSSAEFMQPLVLAIIIATRYIVLAIKDCAVLSICHSGCDPPLRDHYCKPWMSP